MSTRTQTAPAEAVVTELARAVHGEVIGRGDPGYEVHRRVWNGSIDRHPVVIVRCRDAADVQAAVRCAREQGLPLAVRGGGHSFPGLSTCDDGVVVDLSLLREVRVDPAAGTVRVGAGVLLGELDAALQPHGLAVPAGIVSHTGVAGLTLGGGIGWLMRRHGLTVDHLLAVDLVTADGRRVRAAEDENPDLFWALRGGGGNVGVALTFEFAPVVLGPEVLAGPVFWAAEDAPLVLDAYRRWVADCPDELTTILVQRLAPALPGMPPDVVGRPVIGVVSCWCGDLEAGERVLRPLREVGTPVVDLCSRTPFTAHQRLLDPAFRHGCWYYVRACHVPELTDDVCAVIADFGGRIMSPLSSLALWHLGGAVERGAARDIPFGGARSGFTFNINGNSETADGFAEQQQWARDYAAALAPGSAGTYTNFLMAEGDDRVRQAYGDATWARLREVKTRWDPTNLFRLNQNIPPL